MGNQTNKNIVFFAPFGLWTVHNGLDAFLSNVLYLRGFNPSVLICDGLFNQCLLHNNGNKKDICNICFNENKNLFNSDHKNIFKLSSYLNEKEYIEILSFIDGLDMVNLKDEQKFRGHKIGLLAKIGIYHKFSIGNLNLENKKILKQVEENLKQLAILIITINNYLKKHPTDFYILFSGGPIVYRMAQKIFKSHGLKGLAHERGTVTGTYQFFEDENCFSPYNHIKSYKTLFENKNLRLSEYKWILNHLKERQNGENTNFIKFVEKENIEYNIYDVLNIKRDKKIISLLLSTDHDTLQGKDEREHLFNNQIECINYLVKIFANRDEYLIVKPHPAIHIDTKFFSFLVSLQLTVNDNIKILLPRDSLSTYKLIQITDCVLTCGSTVGIESVLYGKPVFTFVKTPYAMADCGVTYVNKKQDILSCLNEYGEVKYKITTKKINNALKYLYYKFYICNFKLKNITIKNNYTPVINIKSHADLMPGKCDALDSIINAIEKNESIFENLSKRINNNFKLDENELNNLVAHYHKSELIKDICLIKVEKYDNNKVNALDKFYNIKVLYINESEEKKILVTLHDILKKLNCKYVHIINDNIIIRREYTHYFKKNETTILQDGYYNPGVWELDEYGEIKYELFTTFYKGENISALTKYINKEKDYIRKKNYKDISDILKFIIWDKEILLENIDEVLKKDDRHYKENLLNKFINKTNKNRNNDIFCYSLQNKLNINNTKLPKSMNSICVH